MTPKEEKFAKEYVKNGGNAAQAAVAAGYSEKTARQIASKKLTKVDIFAYIGEICLKTGI